MTKGQKNSLALAAVGLLAACAATRPSPAEAPEPAAPSAAAPSCASADASAAKPSEDLPAAPPPAATADLPMWRASQLLTAISVQPRWPADLFTGSLYDRRDELKKFVAELAETHGAVAGTEETARPSPEQVEMEVTFQDGVSIPVGIAATEATAYRYSPAFPQPVASSPWWGASSSGRWGSASACSARMR